MTNESEMKGFVCADCGKPAETDNGLCVDCERDLITQLECVFEVRDYAAEGEM